jgi:arylsulfatase A-like enzyme
MNKAAAATPARRPPGRSAVVRNSAILLAISFGLCAGYLDLGVLVFKRYFLNSEGTFRTAGDSPWTVPLGHAVILLVPGLLVAAVNRVRPVPVSWRAVTWIFASVAITSALLRAPLYPVCTLLWSVGLGRVIADAATARGLSIRQTRWICAALVVALGVFAFSSSGWQAMSEQHTVSGLPSSAPGARNVVLVVWDTVRAYDVGPYGYYRKTTPNLAEWARKGVAFTTAMAPAPWTFPSHSSFFTGEWPCRLNSQWKFAVEDQYPTLAEYLATHGYQTAGFVANTNCCSYESGLARGFAHYEDYELSPRTLLSRTVAGKWILTNIVCGADYNARKWINLQSRDARQINDAFLQWLCRRRPDRPFFAFLNLFDAHEPYLPSPDADIHFGVQPRDFRDYQMLTDLVYIDKRKLTHRDYTMARDCYDDCIAYLDKQLGRLLEALKDQGLLEKTDVIITSDHGEAFGLHGFMGHAHSTTLEEIFVPLVILSPAAPTGRLVGTPISLRDLPATVVDMLGLGAASPFPGRSLATCWKLAPGDETPGVVSPAFSEQADGPGFETPHENGWVSAGFQMSLVARGLHYVRDSFGRETLCDLRVDPYEHTNLAEVTSSKNELAALRQMLLDVLTKNPGSPEVEKAYLSKFRSQLEDLVRRNTPQSVAAARRGWPSASL